MHQARPTTGVGIHISQRAANHAPARLARTPPPPARSPAPRDLGLDAVRALAILLVLVAHSHPFFGFGPLVANLASFSGTLGVEVFFSLSGFLIGRILLAQEGQAFGRRAVLTFMARRWLRTLPLYYVFLAVLFAAGWPLAVSDALLLQGFVPAIGWHLPHAWSLGVEEAFYLTLPLLVAGLGAGRLSVARAACATLLIGWTLRLGCYYGASPAGVALEWFRTNPVYRIDACAFGVLAACWLHRRPGRAPWRPGPARRLSLLAGAALAVGVVGAAVIAMFSISSIAAHAPVLNALVALYHLGMLQALNLAAAIAVVAMLGAWPHRAEAAGAFLIAPMAAAAVRTTSRLSYGLYLIHLPLFTVASNATAGTSWAGWPAYLLSLAASFALAALAWRLVEAPALAWRDRHLPAAPAPLPTASATPVPSPILAERIESYGSWPSAPWHARPGADT